MLPLPWEATPGEMEAWFRRQLIQAGEKRRFGFCVHPPCAYRARPDGLTCGGADCLDWLAAAPEENIHHWRQIEVIGLEALAAAPETEPEPEPAAADHWTRREQCAAALLLMAAGASGGIGLGLALLAGLWLGKLRIMAGSG